MNQIKKNGGKDGNKDDLKNLTAQDQKKDLSAKELDYRKRQTNNGITPSDFLLTLHLFSSYRSM